MDVSSSKTALVLLVAAAGSVIFLATRNTPAKRNSDGRVPPVLPSALPIIGHLLQFLSNPEKLLTKASTHYGPETPVQLRLANRRVTMINGVNNILSLFKGSRGLSSEKWLVQILVNGFGVNPSDTPFYLADNTGIGQQPVSESNPVPAEHRIFYQSYHSTHDGLAGKRLEELQNQFIRNFHNQIQQADISTDGGWTNTPDLYLKLLQGMFFRASVTSFCGPLIFQHVPSLESDFWTFEKSLKHLVRELPRWLAPAAHNARDKMKENIAKWHQLAREGYGDTDMETDERLWEENFGSKLFRSRQVMYSKMPLKKDSPTAEDTALLWASAANATPAFGWMILETLQRPGLLERVRAEIAPFVTFPPDGGTPDIDIEGLCQQPLIQSIYAEVLRVHVSMILARLPQKHGFSIGGWQLAKDDLIMASSYQTARAASVWNPGTPEKPHPLDDFWAERFIVDPNDPSSGPVLPHLRPDESRVDQAEKPTRPYFSMDGTAGSWLPYGGGARMCPGRHFAKREIIMGMAMFLTAFDVELEPRDSWIEHDMEYFMFGVMHPKGPVPARLRRRDVKAE
ncbi:cytochrome P450 [Plectosphaerella plurivora]|uniref:Cytochrome P450 n=1 Tax=Plectosphaerella plurivora TaxID=936078 RepID=A0A9P8VKJ3_9PEZI|nr:cytochrome P450 [Plectosphaerella plurivora]